MFILFYLCLRFRRCFFADGITHRLYINKGWYIIFPEGLIITFMMIYLSDYWFLYPLFFYSNYFICRYIDPDLDLSVFTHSESSFIYDLKKINVLLGLLGSFFVGYGFSYSYISNLFGGHRSFFSHGWIIGTIGRMIFYNIPLLLIMINIYSYGLANWGWILSIGLYESMKMQVWLVPYLSMQFLAWCQGDGIHLLLDTEWAKGRLYEHKKHRNQE